METATLPPQADDGLGGGNQQTFNIIVNGRQKKVEQQVLTFQDVINLAYPEPAENACYTVAYKNADQEPRTGTLVEGQSLKVRNGTMFDVKRTIRS